MVTIGRANLFKHLMQRRSGVMVSEIYRRLPHELQLKVIEKYFEDATFKNTGIPAYLTDVQMNRHAILLVDQRTRKQGFNVFLATGTFKIGPNYLEQKKRNDHHLYIRRVVICGIKTRASVETLRAQFPNLQALHINYKPQVRINFGSLPAFAACKSLCCHDNFKQLLLNVMFHGDEKSDKCWISTFKGSENKEALIGNRRFEIKLVMRVKTSIEDEGKRRYLTAVMSSFDYILTLTDSDGMSFSRQQRAIDENEQCGLVPVELDLVKHFAHQWHTPNEIPATTAGPAPAVPSTTP